jgi:hypothetical protein
METKPGLYEINKLLSIRTKKLERSIKLKKNSNNSVNNINNSVVTNNKISHGNSTNCGSSTSRRFKDLLEPSIDLNQPNVTTIMQRPVDMGETKRYKRKNYEDLEKRRTYECSYNGSN